MRRKPYASRRLDSLAAVLSVRIRSASRVRLLSSGVPRWWTTQGRDLPWRVGAHLAAAGLRLRYARSMRLLAMADGAGCPLPPMLPGPDRPIPSSWRADR